MSPEMLENSGLNGSLENRLQLDALSIIWDALPNSSCEAPGTQRYQSRTPSQFEAGFSFYLCIYSARLFKFFLSAASVSQLNDGEEEKRSFAGLSQLPRWQPISMSTLNLIFKTRVQVDYEVDEVIGCAEITQDLEDHVKGQPPPSASQPHPLQLRHCSIIYSPSFLIDHH
jgi:hypothetical protein